MTAIEPLGKISLTSTAYGLYIVKAQQCAPLKHLYFQSDPVH